MKKNAICLKLFWYKVFVHRKLKLVNFLVNVNLKTIWVRVCTTSKWSRYATVFCRWEHENVLRMLLNIKCVRVIIRTKYAPKLGHTPPLNKQNLISNPPHIMIILRLTPPPPVGKKVSSHSFPHSLSTCWIFFLWYKHHFKWIFDVCQRVIRITGLWACVVFAWIERFLIFYSISSTKVPACEGEKLNLIILCFIYHTLNLYCY